MEGTGESPENSEKQFDLSEEGRESKELNACPTTSCSFTFGSAFLGFPPLDFLFCRIFQGRISRYH